MEKQKVLWMNSLRGIACLIVMLSHIGSIHPQYGTYFNGCGKIGVWLFFILSGFWFMLPLCKYNKKITFAGILILYVKKLKQLYLVYTIVLLTALGTGSFSYAKEFFQHLLLIKGQGHFWYMPVIIKFFFVSPIFWFLKNIIQSDAYFGIVLIVLGIIYALMFPYTNYPENSIYLYWYMPLLILGMILSVVYIHLESRKIPSCIFDIIVVLMFIFILSITPWGRQLLWDKQPSSYLQNKYLLIGGIWCAIILSMLCGTFWKNILSNSRFLQWVGDLSYPLYLIHYLVLVKINAFHISWISKGILTVCVSGGIAWIFSHVMQGTLKQFFMDRTGEKEK